MSGKRSYEDGCGTAHALELIGERWALLIARELLLGPKRFTDLRADLRTISANVLTHRLEEMEASGIVVRRKLPPPAASWIYELTPWGYDLGPVISSLGLWAARSPAMPSGLPMSANSLILALRALFDARRAGDTRLLVALDFGSVIFRIAVADGALDAERVAEIPVGATRLACDVPTFDAIRAGRISLAEAIETGRASITCDDDGDGDAVRRLLDLCPMIHAANPPS
ncbi:helix-turn-helix transcriptional regulator [Phyllobacterium sp. 21LDTY02-6]|uniref:winged helix-turn-helix transcriptional regulator n=1 Tax=Phyllobacterium sp. 21LDTY02-6 TaxID=2944903 RepID=UPI002020C210|nr:helix-turn-helix domain-containing protein [Phyllobacterium sp. 21LDTY02-6]MCO4318363.1 helix-turn-helix transcriptional regulator [Phyllobacterium sp. 21LDTY02-6]